MNTYDNEKLAPSSNREYKSSAFTIYYSDPKNAADLYRALSHDPGINPEDIVFTTLQGVLFMARKNDMAFTAGQKVLVIAEHQATINQNMPLRNAIYYGRTMEQLIPPRAMYKNKRISIPTPEFYVFYNGSDPQPKEQFLHLSDSYLEKTDSPMLELSTRIININLPVNHPILQKSRTLYEYSFFMQKIRENALAGMNRDDAIRTAMESCIRQHIMVDFISRHGSEVRNFLFTEFNMKDALEVCAEENYETGFESGMKKGVERGVKSGIETGIALAKNVLKLTAQGLDTETISRQLSVPIEQVRQILE